MQILIEALSINNNFTLTSYTKFYDIFVWQNAERDEQIRFVTNVLMGENTELSIIKISKIIDLICQKINIETINNSLDNFA
jgi:hypothetical protein